MFAKFEQVGNFLALLGLHLHQDFFRAIVRQIGQQVGRRVRFHLFDDVGRAIGIQRLHHRLLEFRLQLFQRARRYFLVQRLEHSLALVRSQFLNDVRYIRRMQLGQPVMRDFQLYAARRIRFNQVHEFPRDFAWGNPQ